MHIDTLPTFKEESKLWSKGYNLVIGVDEVGRGSFAGPMVAGAVAFPPCHPDQSASWRSAEGSRTTASGERDSSTRPPSGGLARNDSVRIDDSKRMRPREREKAAAWIKEHAVVVGIGEVGAHVINRLGLRRATHMAFRQALANASMRLNGKRLHFLLVDAFYVPYVKGLRRRYQKAIVDGDQKSISIAAASIIAKVHRDALMRKLAKKHPHYGWGRNKGYGTKRHQEAIKKNGITRLHRIAFVETFLRTQGVTL